MTRVVAVLDVDAPSADSSESAGRSSAQRFCYSKVVANTIQFVILDVDENGNEEYASQEPGETAWYPFTPSTQERAVVRRALRSGGASMKWQRLEIAEPREDY